MSQDPNRDPNAPEGGTDDEPQPARPAGPGGTTGAESGPESEQGAE